MSVATIFRLQPHSGRTSVNREILLQILDLARWAPSGDNTQPWRFEIVDDWHLLIHGFDERDHSLYDFGGHGSQLAHGALLETLRIAATGFGLEAKWALRPGSTDNAPDYDVFLRARTDLADDPLLSCIERRTVQRRPMRTAPLTPAQLHQLKLAVGPGFTVDYFASWRERWAVAKLLWQGALIRLTCPEAFEVHREIIKWNARFSTHRIPEQALGVSRLTAKLMRWALHSWARVDFLNRYLLGTLVPRLQLDLIPAMACAGHLLLGPIKPPGGWLDYVHTGIALQRLWLTATALGLHLQPEMTPVVFRWYARTGKRLSRLSEIDRQAQRLSERFERLAQASNDDRLVFLCRVGQSMAPRSRSLRRSLGELLVAPKAPTGSSTGSTSS